MKDLRPPLLITGCPRSGTSLTASIYRALGCWVGDVTSQTENTAIRERILKPILRDGGMDDLALRRFANVEASPDLIRENVRDVLRAQGYEDGPWLYKDVKLVFCWRSWAEAFPGATWAVVWRPPKQIEASMARWQLAGRVEFNPWDVIDAHHERARKIEGAHAVFPEHFIYGDDSEYRNVALDYGVPWIPDIARRQIDPERFRS